MEETALIASFRTINATARKTVSLNPDLHSVITAAYLSIKCIRPVIHIGPLIGISCLAPPPQHLILEEAAQGHPIRQ